EASGAAGLPAHGRVLGQVAKKGGAVGCSAAMVSHPQRGAAKISARPATNPASTPPARLTPPAIVANWYANCRPAWRQLPDLGSFVSAVAWQRCVTSGHPDGPIADRQQHQTMRPIRSSRRRVRGADVTVVIERLSGIQKILSNALIRRKLQAIADTGLGQDMRRTGRIGLELLPQSTDKHPQI